MDAADFCRIPAGRSGPESNSPSIRSTRRRQVRDISERLLVPEVPIT